MPKCRYCETVYETDGDLAEHLAETHDEEELTRIDERIAEERASASSSRLSRRAFAGLVATAAGTGAIAATQASSVGIDGGLLPDENGPSSTSSHQLVASYPFDGDLDDASGNGFNGVFVNGGGFAEGVFGQAVELDGVIDYVRVDATKDEITPSGAEWTMSAWVFSDGATGDQILRRDESAGGGFLYNLRINDDQTVRLEYDRNTDNNTDTTEQESTTETVPVSEWTHVAAVIENSSGTIYIDGKPKATNSDVHPSGNFDSINGGELSIGAFGLAGSENFDGRIDKARLYDRALSDAEIEQLAEAPPAIQIEGDNATFDNTTITSPDS